MIIQRVTEMKLKHTMQNLLVLTLCAFDALLVSIASPIFDGTSSNVWVMDDTTGNIVAGFSLPVSSAGWSVGAFQSSQSTAVVKFESGVSDVIADLQLGSQTLMVNQAQQSLPLLSGGLPAISLIGLDQGLSSLVDPAAPGVSIYPEQGNYTDTIAVRINAVSGRNNSKRLKILWKVNGDTQQQLTSGNAPEDGFEHTIYLASNGTYRIEYSARQGRSSTTRKTIRYTLSAADPLRDSDGDGIPDQWEAENGMNPLVNDFGLDSDGDGWTDFEELIRGSDPYDDMDTPTDSDGDGWSDFDEKVRGTDPNDTPGTPYPDVPTARRLHEVEYLVTGSIFSDDAELSKQTLMGQLTIVDINGDVLYDQTGLPTADELALTVPLLTETSIPLRLRRTEAEAALAAGDLPLGLRIPAGEVMILRSRQLDIAGEANKWVVKSWLDNVVDVHPGEVTAWLAQSGNTWTTATEWQAGYQNYLSSKLVQDVNMNLSPVSGLGTALTESVINWYGGLSEGAIMLLGNTESADVRAAVNDLRQALDIDGRSLNELHQELTTLTGTGLELSDFAAAVSSFYVDTGSFTESTTTRATAAFLQGSEADPVFNYISRLMAFNKLSVIDNLPVEQRTALMDPMQDFDADGLLNGIELDAAINAFSDPLKSDTDGDTLPDNIDPCATDADNLCLFLGNLQSDTDGDGVFDAVDNCVNLPNINQEDSNNDGIGDACREYANIRYPITNITIWVGQSVNFSSMTTELLPDSIEYNWDFGGGAANSTAENPGAVRFEIPGNYRVRLTAIDSSSGVPANGDDFRIIHVVGSGPSVDAGGPYNNVVEGQSLNFNALATTPAGSIVSYSWNFGDGNVSTGNPVKHVYTSNGNYLVQVTVADSNQLTASNTVPVTVADTVPLASMIADRRSGVAPFTVNYTDTSSAYDGLVSWSWDFGDDSVLDTRQNTSHTFMSRGIYTSVLEVADRDGSVASDALDILVSSGFLLLADRNADGIPGAWSCGGSVICLATNDDDSDGFSNIDEYRADTDPGNTADKPEGVAPLSYVLFRDDFKDSHYNDRWSVGLMSAAATAIDIMESGSTLSATLLQPDYPGEACSSFSMIGFPTVSGDNFLTHVRNRLDGNGTICTVLVNGEQLDNRIEACAVADAGGDFNVVLRSYDAGVLTVEKGVAIIPALSVVDWKILKLGNMFELYTNVAGNPLAVLQASIINTSIGSADTRPLLKLESCATDSGSAKASFDLIEILLDRDADGLADMNEDSNNNGNIDVTESDPLDPDTDSDGVLDGKDNCLLRANTSQRDSNADGYGNRCDPDLNNDLKVDFADVAILKSTFFTSGQDSDADINDDGRVDFADLSAMKAMFFSQPGPSALAP